MKNYILAQLIGLILLIPVLISQFFKSQTPFLQTYTPYLTIIGLLLLLASFVLRVKANDGQHYNFRLGFMLLFFVGLILGLVLIYHLTT
ncbi:MAG: hypothetical protein EOO87_08425 [Pedobacter sp.]|nr:MAG: hypothetical protein EOO87_08425 [Pedobacter sp.]